MPMQPDKVTSRPPVLARCAHRAVFELSKRKDLLFQEISGVMVLVPFLRLVLWIHAYAWEQVSAGHGAAKAFKEYNLDKHVVSVLGLYILPFRNDQPVKCSLQQKQDHYCDT